MTTSATVATRIEAVAKAIAAAGRAAGTMLAKVKEAAKAAAPQLDPALPLGERVDAVVALYKEDFAAVDHNVRALFKDALLLVAAAAAPVTLVTKVKGEEVEKHVTAAEALDAPKHAMRDAAKQVREQNGMARAAGGGRKTGARHATDKVITAGDKAAVGTGDQNLAAWLDNVAAYMADAKTRARVVAAFKEAGYKVTAAK